MLPLPRDDRASTRKFPNASLFGGEGTSNGDIFIRPGQDRIPTERVTVPNQQDSRLLDLVAEAVAMDPEARGEWLRRTCGDNLELRAEIEALLGFNDDADQLLQLSGAATSASPVLPRQREEPSAAVGAVQSGDRLGDYEIVKQIGAGGMGIVYEAMQLSLNRSVAVKVLPANLRSSPNSLARFRREVEAVARLRHDNIVAIHTTGDDGTISYYAMELVDGLSLSEVLAGLRRDPIPELQMSSPPSHASLDQQNEPAERATWLTALLTADDATDNNATLTESPAAGSPAGNYFEVVAGLLAQVADGLSYAHSHQIVHRDIKPSNLLLSRDGRLHISDFGLARIIAEPAVTQTGEFVGTPYYMAPEQTNSALGDIDGRTDVYALGATLYEMLALRPPFPGSSRDEVLASIARHEHTPPRRLNSRVPRDLETICLKALEKHPAQRYPGAGEMADDLRRFVGQMPISAKRSGFAARSMKWCRRHPSMAASLIAACSLGLIATALAYSAHESAKDKVLAEQQRDDVVARASRIEQDLHSAHAAVIRAQQTEHERVFERALLAAMQGDEEAVQSAVRRAEQLDVPPGRLHILRGQIALFSADFEQGLAEFEAAIELLPNNLAAQALLGETHARLEQWETSRKILERVREIGANSTEDLILMGRMESYHDPASAEETLDLAIARDRKNIAARLIRGIIRAKRAYHEGDPAAAERALSDFRQASSFLEETPYLLSELLRANLTAAAAYEAAGQQAAQQRHLEEAGVLAERLRKYQLDYQAHRWRAYYFDQIGDLDSAVAEWQSIQQKTIGFLVMTLYRAGRFDEALVACDIYEAGAITGTSDFCHSFVVAASCDSAEELLADFNFETMLAWNRNTTRRSAYILWCLAGQRDRAAEEVRAIGIADSASEPSRNLFDFVSGSHSAKEYLTKSRPSREGLSRAHLIVGIDCLARGQRNQAREHFEQSADYRLNYEFFTAMSRALLAQLDRDPAWPPWIPISDRDR
ncbi:protein kinase [Pirellulales bacterium]|nr:protein kinase [Pirellulales bacterium]